MSKYLIILDNAKYHIQKKVIKFCLENKLKVLSNFPYYSVFNAIEYVFLNIKSSLYKRLIKNTKELKKYIKNIINDEKFKITLKKIYADELDIYFRYIEENKMIIFKKFLKIFSVLQCYTDLRI